MEDKNQKLPSTSINWDSGAYRKLSVSIDISDFQKNTFYIFNKK